MMQTIRVALLMAFVGVALGVNSTYNPVAVTINQSISILATPITPAYPYPQNLLQCNVTGYSGYPPYATGTFPLTVTVPVGNLVRVVFANGNLNGATVTQQGQAGVIVQQGGAVIVQQAGGASPIVQNVASPVLQSNAPAAAQVVQQSPTVVQQNAPSSPIVQQPPATPTTPSTPNPTTTPTPATPTPTPTTTTTPTSTPTTTPTKTPTPTTTSTPTPTTTSTPTPTPTNDKTPTPTPTITSTPTPTPTNDKTTTPTPTPTNDKTTTPTPTPTNDKTTTPTPTPTDDKTPTPTPSTTSTPIMTGKPGRKILQDTVPGGPNNGLVEYVGLVSSNTVPGFVVPNTQFGVPYVEFTSTAAAIGQTAIFQGALVVAQVVGGVPLYPFQVNSNLSPFCQVNVNFVAVAASG